MWLVPFPAEGGDTPALVGPRFPAAVLYVLLLVSEVQDTAHRSMEAFTIIVPNSK